MKTAKKRSWQSSSERLKSDRKSANKKFKLTIRRIGEKKVGGVGQVKSKNGILLYDKKSILCCCRKYFSEFINSTGGTVSGKNDVLLGVENITIIKKVLPAIKSLKSGKSKKVD